MADQEETVPKSVAQTPTYSTLTAERILAYFDINLDHDHLAQIINDEDSVYYQLLKVPHTNLLNGIVLQQAADYQAYAQKLFVDYLMSGEGNDDNKGPGEQTREDLEAARVDLVDLGKEFDELSREHKLFIAASQRKLMAEVKGQPKLDEARAPVKEQVDVLSVEAEMIGVRLREFRQRFKDKIIAVKKMLQQLSDFKFDDDQDNQNLSDLAFDDKIT